MQVRRRRCEPSLDPLHSRQSPDGPVLISVPEHDEGLAFRQPFGLGRSWSGLGCIVSRRSGANELDQAECSCYVISQSSSEKGKNDSHGTIIPHVQESHLKILHRQGIHAHHLPISNIL